MIISRRIGDAVNDISTLTAGQAEVYLDTQEKTRRDYFELRLGAITMDRSG